MNTPKIRWYAQKDEYRHFITAEISLGRVVDTANTISPPVGGI